MYLIMRLSKLGLFKVIVTELYNLSQFHCLLYIGAKIKDFRAVADDKRDNMSVQHQTQRMRIKFNIM